MYRKEMIAMILAGGQKKSLGVLTEYAAKPAVEFGGKYRIIDFTLSNCINSGIDTVGVLTGSRPLRLNSHIGIGIPWDLDKLHGGITILPPPEKKNADGWYQGDADAVFQNMEYVEACGPEYVLILPGDQVYKMDYQVMLDFHKANRADVTAACAFPDSGEKEFTGICIFRWEVLKKALQDCADLKEKNFVRDIIPVCRKSGCRICTYEFNSCWRSLDTLPAYWKANMELTDIEPELNLYEEFWKVYTKTEIIRPCYFSAESKTEFSLFADGCEVFGEVYNSVIGPDVTIQKGAVIRNSVIMRHTVIGENAAVSKAVVGERCRIGNGAVIGTGEKVPNVAEPDVYRNGLVAIGENTVIPDMVQIGKNSVITGVTLPGDYPDGRLPAGSALLQRGGDA